LAEAGGPADVGIDDRDAELVQEIVVAADEDGAGLAFRSAVNADDHRTLARESRRRAVVEAGHLEAVEALPAHQLRLRQFGGDQSADLALGPARDRAPGGVERVHVGGRARARDREPQLATVAMPGQRAE